MSVYETYKHLEYSESYFEIRYSDFDNRDELDNTDFKEFDKIKKILIKKYGTNNDIITVLIDLYNCIKNLSGEKLNKLCKCKFRFMYNERSVDNFLKVTNYIISGIIYIYYIVYYFNIKHTNIPYQISLNLLNIILPHSDFGKVINIKAFKSITKDNEVNNEIKNLVMYQILTKCLPYHLFDNMIRYFKIEFINTNLLNILYDKYCKNEHILAHIINKFLNFKNGINTHTFLTNIGFYDSKLIKCISYCILRVHKVILDNHDCVSDYGHVYLQHILKNQIKAVETDSIISDQFVDYTFENRLKYIINLFKKHNCNIKNVIDFIGSEFSIESDNIDSIMKIIKQDSVLNIYNDHECTICFQEYDAEETVNKVVLMPCGHMLCQDCKEHINNKCHVCKSDIVSSLTII